MTPVGSAAHCWQASGATYLLKVFFVLFPSLQKPLSAGQFNHYAAELAFYWSLMFSQFIDVKRKVSKQTLLCCLSTALLDMCICVRTVLPAFHVRFISYPGVPVLGA